MVRHRFLVETLTIPKVADPLSALRVKSQDDFLVNMIDLVGQFGLQLPLHTRIGFVNRMSDVYVVARVRQKFREELKAHVAKTSAYMSLSDFARRALEEKYQRDLGREAG